MTQAEVDDIIYIAGRKAEDFLKEKYAGIDLGYEIEKHIDWKEEVLQSVSDNDKKFNEFLKTLNDFEILDSEFKNYIRTIYPSITI